jgi:hypothetical protein
MKLDVLKISVIVIGCSALILAALYYSTSVDRKTSDKIVVPVAPIIDSMGDEIEIVRIDGCEYIRAKLNSNCTIYAHKGDCDNPIHVYNK